jgi:hypothetical protein
MVSVGSVEQLESIAVVERKRDEQKVQETRSEGLPHAPRHAAKRYRAEEKYWPTTESPNQSRLNAKFLISPSHALATRNRNTIRVSKTSPRVELGLSFSRQNKFSMPGATTTESKGHVQILDPTSETNEEIDPAVDRDRIRVVR